MKTRYKVTYSDYVDADSKEEALEIAVKEIESLFRNFAKVTSTKAEGK